MKKKTKKVLLACCIAAFSCSLVAFTACEVTNNGSGGGGVTFVEEEKKVGPQFLEGALADIIVGDTVRLDEYIEDYYDYWFDSDHVITITDKNGAEQELDLGIWIPNAPGDYVLTYTIKSGDKKGTSTFTFHVSYPELTWQFTLSNLPRSVDDTMYFADYFGAMNIYASLPEDVWKVCMDSVVVGDVEIDLSNADGYTFKSRLDHTFKFHIEATDGQRLDAREVISIRDVHPEAMANLKAMGISTYGELYVTDDEFTTVPGSYNKGTSNPIWRENGPHSLPYLAYNGNYGIGDFVKIDFTGNNMPLFSYFRKTYSESIFDQTRGFAFSGGFTGNDGKSFNPTISARGTLYGPYMLHYYDNDAADTRRVAGASGTVDSPFAGSISSLRDGTRYRVITGFSGVEQGTANHIVTGQPTPSLFLTYKFVLINLDTGEVLNNYSVQTYAIQALGFSEIPLATTNNSFFKGNIVLYGQYGKRTTWDKIYPVITGKSFEEICAEEITVSSFKPGVQTFFTKAVTLNVSDYADLTPNGSYFYYVDENGTRYDVTGGTFRLTGGNYTFYYCNGTDLPASLKVFVGNYSDDLINWIDTNGVKLHEVSGLNEDHGFTLNAGSIGGGASYSKGQNDGGSVHQAYLAIDGDGGFGLDSYIAFDFTGKNMPEIAFFAKNYNDSMYRDNADPYHKQGIVIQTGITKSDGSLLTDNQWVCGFGRQIVASLPHMINDTGTNAFEPSDSNSTLTNFESKLARQYLDDSTQYRVVMGFTHKGANATRIVLHWGLYKLEGSNYVEVERASMSTWNYFTGRDKTNANEMGISDLVGSIVFYGKFGTTCTIDKIHGVYRDASVDGVLESLGMN